MTPEQYKPNLLTYIQLIRAGWVMAREGAFSVIDPDTVPGLAGLALRGTRFLERRAVRQTGRVEKLAGALIRLGPSYVKMGQFLATRPDVVGIKVAQDLRQLQDQLPPFKLATAIEIIQQRLGARAEDLLPQLSQPIAAASIAQVHRTQYQDRSGRTHQVAVKILRPGIRQRFLKDLRGFQLIALWALRLVPDAARLKPLDIVQTMARSTKMEMDFRFEAAAMSQMAENTAHDTYFEVPAIYWDVLDADILVTSWVDGIKLSQPNALIRAGVDRKQLGVNVILSFLTHAVRDGFFHADMHPGNLFVTSKGKLVAVDFGIMGQLDLTQRRFLAHVLHGFITRRYYDIARAHFEIGYVPKSQSIDDFALALRSIGEPLVNRPMQEISMAQLLGLLFEVTALFEMKARPELILLQKTMVVVEGVARDLDCEINFWAVAEPIVKDWIIRLRGPEGIVKNMRQNAKSALNHIENLPATLDKINDLIDRAHEQPPPQTSEHLKMAIWLGAIGLAGLLVINLISLF